MKKLLLSALALTAGLLALSAQGTQDAPQPDVKAINAAIVKAQRPSYPLDTCVISGKQLGTMGDPIEHVVDGRLVRLCCKGCVPAVDKDKAGVVKKIERAVVLAQKDLYPLDTCVVSGEKLGAMGDIIDHVDGTRLVRFCCDGCAGAYAKDPASYMADVDKALIAKLTATYPLTVCPISGKELGTMGAPIDRLHGVQLVRLCCKGCVAPFEKDPKAALAKVAEARKAQKTAPADR